MNKEPIIQSPAIRAIADIDFNEIYTMSGLKYQEYQIWKDKEDIIVEAVLMERFPSLDYNHFQTNILPLMNQRGVKPSISNRNQSAALVQSSSKILPIQ